MKPSKYPIKPKAAPQRTCMGTGAVCDKADLLRFVIAPNVDTATTAQQVFLDITGKAPGRGVYCLPTREALELAIKKRGFSRKLKAQVPADMVEQVERALKQDALHTLGLAKKAAALAVGVDDILENKQKLAGLVLATDIGKDATKKLSYLETEICQIFTNDELAYALGLPYIAAIGLTIKRFWPKFRRLQQFNAAAKASNGETT